MGEGNKNGSCATLAAVAVLAGMAPQTALAQSESEAPDEVPTIVVTAQFRETDVQATPLAITVMNSEMLEQRGITDVLSVAQTAPNVTLSAPNGSYGKSTVAYIRGIGQFDFNPALEPGVGIYIDDVYYPTVFGTQFDLIDPERVEILRGPQGTLAGKNSIGGAIKLYSKKPTGDASGFVQAGMGGFDRLDATASADFTVIPDTVFARISGVLRKEDGYVRRVDYGCENPGSGYPNNSNSSRSCDVGTLGGKDVKGARAYVRFALAPNFEFNVIADYLDDDSEANAVVITKPANPTVAAFMPPADDPYVSYSTFMSVSRDFAPPPVNAAKNWGVSGQVDWDLSDALNLVAIGSYRGTQGRFVYDGDVSPRDVTLFDQEFDSKSYTGEIRLNGTIADAFDWTIGGYVYHGEVINGGRVIAAGPGFNFVQDDLIDNDSKSVFAHGILHVTDRLDLIAGGRYTEESKDYEFHRRQADGSFNAFVARINGASGRYDGDRFDYRLAANYQVTPDVMVYGQLSTGFKGGGIGPRPFFAEQVQPFDPEYLTSYEVGLKSYLFDRALRLNLAGFISDYKDIQITLRSCDQFSPAPGSPCSLPQNAGDATIKGLELESQLTLDGLSLDGSISYLDFEYTEINAAANIPLARVAPFTPEWQASLGVQYAVPLPGGSTLTPRFDVTHRSSIFADATNNPNTFVPRLTLVNARLGWRSADESWELAAAVTNVFDKLYYYTNEDFLGTTGVVSSTIAPPRRWFVSVKRMF